ncbi:hypothetical protein L1887_19450 [Cichorium endivia]|nr:hypothetical protein L1887_19450 [Cichorium endivia]
MVSFLPIRTSIFDQYLQLLRRRLTNTMLILPINSTVTTCYSTQSFFPSPPAAVSTTTLDTIAHLLCLLRHQHRLGLPSLLVRFRLLPIFGLPSLAHQQIQVGGVTPKKCLFSTQLQMQKLKPRLMHL